MLGFEVPPPVEGTHVGLNPATITIRKDKGYNYLPTLGTFADVWKQREGDDILDYYDPMYQTICQQGLKPEFLKRAAINPSSPRVLSNECLSFAKEMLPDVPDVQIMDIAGDFGLCTNRHDSISYHMSWYRVLDEQHDMVAPKTAYGLPSASSLLKKPKVSELIIYINCYRSGVTPTSLGKKEDITKKLPPIETKNQSVRTNEGIEKENDHQDSENPRGSLETQPTAENNAEPKINGPEPNPTDAATDLKLTPVGENPKEVHHSSPHVVPNHVGAMNEQSILLLTALALEHGRACDIWYGLVQVPTKVAVVLIKYFRMVQLSVHDDLVTLVCDLKKCSFKYAFLLFKNPKADEYVPPAPSFKKRMLVRLPNVEDANIAIKGDSLTARKSIMRPKRANIFFSGVGPTLQKIAFGVRVNAADGALQGLDKEGNLCDEPLDISNFAQDPAWDVLKSFSMPAPAAIPENDQDDQVLNLLTQKQIELATIEDGMEPKLRSLLTSVLKDRTQFEIEADKRAARKRVLDEYQAILERRKEIDMAWQSQIDQDMDAVCEICNDGEVTPDNQILFCEACNVAVHQMCYGIERVPSGDYYCIACRYFEREKMGMVVAKQLERGANVKISPSPLPICCELCPRKQGAFIRTDTSKHRPDKDSKMVLSRWVHVLCAKWSGLNFVNEETKDCVEDVLELKVYFRLQNISCMLCQSNRGAFIKCRAQGCNEFLHVSCARSSGLCEVTHGENCHGPVESNPWSLLCPTHSGSDPSFIPNAIMNVDQLIMAAKEFPPEKIELPKPKASLVFHKMLGKERTEAMKDRLFEDELIDFLLKKNYGVRCESCFQYEEDGKNLTRCMSCSVVFCDSCTSDGDGISLTSRSYKCPACKIVEEKKKVGEGYETPQCSLCVQKGGWLRAAQAVPMKMSAWKSKKNEWARTLFAKQFWCHQLCQM